jgi:hypothetical protein
METRLNYGSLILSFVQSACSAIIIIINNTLCAIYPMMRIVQIYIRCNETGIQREIEVNMSSDAVFIHNLYHDATVYHVQVAAYNRLGEGARSETVTVG